MAETPIKFKPIHPVATILNHLRLIGLISIIGTVILVALIAFKVKPTYSAESAVEITMVHSGLLTDDREKNFTSRHQYVDYLRTQVSYIVSYENLSAALKRVDLNQTVLPNDETFERQVMLLTRMVNARWVPNTNLISLSVSSTDPHGLHLLCNAIIEAYIEGLKEAEMGTNTSRINHLDSELQQERSELASMNQQLTTYTTQLGTLDLEEGTIPHEQTLAFLRDSLNEAFVERLNAENNLNALLERLEKAKELDLDPLIEERVREEMASLEDETRQDQAALSRESAMVTESHPRLKRLQQEIEQAKAHYEETQALVRERTERLIRERLDLDNERALLEAQGEFNARSRTEESLRQRYTQEQARLNEVIPMVHKAIDLRSEIERTRERITRIENRLEELTVESKGPGRVRIQTEARFPKFPSKNRRKLLAIMALFACIGFAIVLAFAIDYLEQSIISPQHMAQIIGTRPTGVLASSPLPDYGQLLRVAPESYEADTLRRILPRIFDVAGTPEDPRLITILPLTPGAGASSFALNCMTYLHNIDRNAGFLDLSAGVSDLESRTADWNLQENNLRLSETLQQRYPLRMRSGPLNEFYTFKQTRSEETLSDQDQLRALLDQLSKRTGTVLIEGPPLLQNSEAEVLCRLSQRVVLVVNGPETVPGALSRGMGLLKELGVKECAVIANNLPILPGGYFAKAKAAYEGEEIRYPMLHELRKAIVKALIGARGGAK